MKPTGLKMTESLVQGKLARRVRWGGCGNVHLERDATRRVLTLSLSERRDAYKLHERVMVSQTEDGQPIIAHMVAPIRVRPVSYYQQKRDIVEIKDIREEYKGIHSQVLQNVLERLEKAFQAFFRRIKNGETPGYPRFQGRNRYNSFCYPQGGYTLSEKHVTFSKIGTIRVKMHREIEGKIKTATVKFEAGQWYVVFSCECEQPEPLPVVVDEVGIDLGVTHFAALSDGTFIENPRHYRKAEKTVERRQQALSRKKRGSHRREKARRLVAQAHRKIRNQRRDFLHKASRHLVKQYQTIVFEDLQIANLVKAPKAKQDEQGHYLPNGAAAKGGLTKSILDAGWGMFREMCTYKAACAGRTIAVVDPKYTSQVCSHCGVVRKKELSERWHSCDCGCELDRDTNAAINILSKHLSARTEPTQK